MTSDDKRRAYWRRTRWLTLVLLGVWGLVTFAPAWWAQGLNRYSLFGWPIAYYMGAQGTLLVYLAIVGIYVWTMERLDRRYGVEEEAYVEETLEPEVPGDDDE
ncbi:MAG TPA: DUF4212 domain-containing protein [Parasulfuritortus sp.]